MMMIRENASAAETHSIKAVRDVFFRWNPDDYLREYYSRIEAEEEHTLRFLVEQCTRLPSAATVLEFGCGPTLHHVLPFAAHASLIHMADLLPQNLEAIRRWQMPGSCAHDWRPFTKRVLALEGLDATPDDIEHREQIMRKLITRRLRADARCARPLGLLTQRYDCVVSCYCADSATGDKREWQRMIENIVSLLAPGGRLLIAALRRCERYTVGAQSFPSARIDEDDLASLFSQLELRNTSIEIVAVPDRSTHGFESILLASATAPAIFAIALHSHRANQHGAVDLADR